MEKFIESLFGLKLFASPLLAASVLGFILKLYIGGETGNFAFGVMLLIGIIGGFILLKYVKKDSSFSEFDSKVNASPDIDEAIRNKKI